MAITEKRSHARYKAKERALVIISEDTLPYHIIDISLGGLALRYIGEKQRADTISEVNLLYGNKIYLEKVPVESVSDNPLPDGYVPMRRLSVKYRSLDAEQKSRLKSFIKSHTHGVVSGTITP